MKLFLDIIYVLIENLIYVMYLDLFFKNREEVKYNKIFFIVFMSFLSLMMNKYCYKLWKHYLIDYKLNIYSSFL